eukprot:TRINITY_DN27385_c0_g1_i1.p1 TRINITY_DN27385_c0_g1~~TRINITY_DN27385_c0_g1_i1.p1  ORF type:complete len:473 (-),score=118.20 TRINITY_DN27385_c0_g1_i1:72-1490(-)
MLPLLRRNSVLLRRAFCTAASEEQPRGGSTLKRLAAAGLVGGTATFAGFSYRDGPAVTLARVDGKLRPCLASVLPHSVFVWLYSSSRSLFQKMMSAGGAGQAATEFPSPCTVMGLRFRGDLGNAAGLDKDASLLDFNYDVGAGFAVVGTVLSEGHTGNVFTFFGGLWSGNVWTPLPLSGGALNSLGLPGHGVDYALRNLEEFRKRRGIQPQVPGSPPSPELLKSLLQDGGKATGTHGIQGCFPIGVSIMGHPKHEGKQKLDGVLDCVRKSIPLADFIEINESCPNVKHGGGADAAKELAGRLAAVTAVRDELAKTTRRRVPILVKLGDVGDAASTVKLVSQTGIDGIVAVNTQRDYASFDMPATDRSILEHYTTQYSGGLSGSPIRQRSLDQVKSLMSAVTAQRGLAEKGFCVIHVGGLSTAGDVGASRKTGAQLRQWYTGYMNALAEGHCPTGQLYPQITAVEAPPVAAAA